MKRYKVYIKGGGICYEEANSENEAIIKARRVCPNVINRAVMIK